MVPHWFATTDYVEVNSPAGITVRVREGKRRDPVSVVAFATREESKARSYVSVSEVMGRFSTGARGAEGCGFAFFC